MTSYELSEILGIKHESVKKRIRQRFDCGTYREVKISTKGRPLSVYELKEDHILYLSSTSRSMTREKADLISKASGLSVNVLVSSVQSRAESELVSALECAIDPVVGLDVEAQYPVLGYNIDVAIVSDRSILIIECDEYCHQYRKDDDEKRMKSIVGELIKKYESVHVYRFESELISIAIAQIITMIHCDYLGSVTYRDGYEEYMSQTPVPMGIGFTTENQIDFK